MSHSKTPKYNAKTYFSLNVIIIRLIYVQVFIWFMILPLAVETYLEYRVAGTQYQSCATWSLIANYFRMQDGSYVYAVFVQMEEEEMRCTS